VGRGRQAMSDVAPSVQAPKTTQDVLRVILARLPKAMVPIDGIAKRLEIPPRDVCELVRRAEADGVLTIWGDHCLLSAEEARRRLMSLVSTPHRAETSPSQWYWVFFRNPKPVKFYRREKFAENIERINYYVNHPWMMPLNMLPGSYRNRMRWYFQLC